MISVIWALARNTIRQAVRMKAGAVLITLFVLCSIALPFTMEADGTLTGLLKVILTYSITLASVLLLALTLLLSTSVLDQEITGKQIYILAAKPVHRWQLLVGKWLGIVILDAVLLVIMGVVTYGIVYYTASKEDKNSQNYKDAEQKVLTRRLGIRPPGFDLDEQARLIKEDLITRGFQPKDIDSQGIKVQLERELEKRSMKIPVGQRRRFKLTGIPAPEKPLEDQLEQAQKDENFTIKYSGKKLTVRYKVYATDGSKSPLYLSWYFVHPDTQAVVPNEFARTRDGEFREFEIPQEVVNKKGEVIVDVANMTVGNPNSSYDDERKPHVISLSLKEGLEVLAPSGPFWVNLACAMALVLIRMSMIAAIGIAASAYLHFAVAAFLVLTFIVSGFLRTFLGTQVERSLTKAKTAEMQEKAQKDPKEQDNVVVKSYKSIRDTIVYPGLRVFLNIPSKFEDTDPTPDLIVGREISVFYLAEAAFYNLLLRGGGAFLLGIILIYRRELGLPNG